MGRAKVGQAAGKIRQIEGKSEEAQSFGNFPIKSDESKCPRVADFSPAVAHVSDGAG